MTNKLLQKKRGKICAEITSYSCIDIIGDIKLLGGGVTYRNHKL